MEKHQQHQHNLFHNFIDLKKAFDRVWHAGLRQVLSSFNIEEELVQAIQALNKKSSSAVLLNIQLGEFIKTTVGVRHVCLLSSILFNIILRSCRKHSMTTTHPSPLVEIYTTYNLLMASVLRAAAMVNFKTLPTDS